MAKKIGTLILILVISILLASIYGVLHNQISYSISSEYFTKFKFDQIGKWLHQVENERVAISFVGFVSTWWFGLLIGLIIGIVGIFKRDSKVMWKSGIGAVLRTLGIAIVFGFLGILVGKFIISNINASWNLPIDLADRKSFLTAGTMHNFSYLGGIVGLIFGVKHQLKVKKVNAEQN